MAEDRVVTEAYRVLIKIPPQRHYEAAIEYDMRCAQALHAAGLLATDLHKRALEACERLAKAGGWIAASDDDNRLCADIGALSLASKRPPQPSPTWRFQPAGHGGVGSAPMLVCDARSIALVGLTQREAEIVAAALASESPR